MKVNSIGSSNQNFEGISKVVKQTGKGTLTTFYNGAKKVGFHNISKSGQLSGERVFADGSKMQYYSVPGISHLFVDVTGKMAGDVDKSLTAIRRAEVPSYQFYGNPNAFTRKGMVEALSKIKHVILTFNKG